MKFIEIYVHIVLALKFGIKYYDPLRPYPSIIVHPNSILKPTDFLIFDETVFIFGAEMPLNITNGEDRGH